MAISSGKGRLIRSALGGLSLDALYRPLQHSSSGLGSAAVMRDYFFGDGSVIIDPTITHPTGRQMFRGRAIIPRGLL